MLRRASRKGKVTRPASSSAKGSLSVILVDDDSLVRTALSRLLRGLGLRVTAFEHPSDVLLSVLPKLNTCLILDIYMPEMSGVQLWGELKAQGFQVPTILITGKRDEQAMVAGEQVGATAVLYKPIEEKELFEAIERALVKPGG
jgi:FixJ family two-component response regulator